MTKARGMEVAGAVDSHLVGQDIGKVSPLTPSLPLSHSLVALFLFRKTSSFWHPDNHMPLLSLECSKWYLWGYNARIDFFILHNVYSFYYKVCDMEEALEIPIINDLTMILGSISQVSIILQPIISDLSALYLWSDNQTFDSWKQLQLSLISLTLPKFMTMWSRLVFSNHIYVNI